MFSNISIQPAPTGLPVFGVCTHSSALVWTECFSYSQKCHLGMRHRDGRDGGDRVDGGALQWDWDAMGWCQRKETGTAEAKGQKS